MNECSTCKSFVIHNVMGGLKCHCSNKENNKIIRELNRRTRKWENRIEFRSVEPSQFCILWDEK